MKAHELAAAQTVDRTTATAEICTAILGKLPPRLSRHRLQQLLARIETALHISLPGSRFRGAAMARRCQQQMALAFEERDPDKH